MRELRLLTIKRMTRWIPTVRAAHPRRVYRGSRHHRTMQLPMTDADAERNTREIA